MGMAEKTQTSASPSTNTTPRRLYRALEAKSLRGRNFATRLADYLTGLTSTPLFLFLNMALFAGWIAINVGAIPGVQPFDPFPFGLLTMAVSLEAIFLSIFVLVSQNRAAQTATLREELHLRINLIAEQEVTKILEVLSEMRTKMDIKTPDLELEEMLKAVNTSDIEQSILSQIGRADQLIQQPHFSKKDLPGLLSKLIKSVR
jgi:uncharacterized membrane protein